MTALADGDGSDYIRTAIRDLEAQAAHEKAAIAELVAISEQPIAIPSPEELLGAFLDVERWLTNDIPQCREAVRLLFEDGKITLHPGDDGIYTAEASFLPLNAKRLARKPGVRDEYTVVVAGAGFVRWTPRGYAMRVTWSFSAARG